MVVTPLPMVAEVRPLQPEKADSPIDVMLLGMMTEMRLLHPKKAKEAMDVTLLGMVVFLQPCIKVLLAVSIIALQLSRESYFVLPLSTLMEVRPIQLTKA